MDGVLRCPGAWAGVCVCCLEGLVLCVHGVQHGRKFLLTAMLIQRGQK